LEIEDCIHVDPDISIWHWIYLYDQGYNLDQVKQIQHETNKIIKSQIRGSFDDDHRSFDM
jgi:hypothetical protein